MRDIHIGKWGSEIANEEQSDKLRKTVRFEQDAPNTSSSSTMHVSPEYPVSGERQDRPGPVVVQNSGHVDDNIEKSWTSEESWNNLKNDKSNQNIVMNQKFAKNVVMIANIDSKVVMDLSISKIGGWNN